MGPFGKVLSRTNWLVVTSLFILVTGVLVVPPATAQETLQLGYVDVQSLIENYNAYQSAKETLGANLAKHKQDLDVQYEEIKKDHRRLQLKEGLWPNEEEKMREWKALQERMSALDELAKQKDEDMNTAEQELIKPLIERMDQVIQSVARESGYHLVFRRIDLAFGDPRLDLTEDVLAVLNAE